MPVALNLAVQILGILSPFITMGLGWLGVQASRLVQARTGSTTAATAILKLNEIVTTVVTEIEQTMVAAAKARTGGGHMTQADIDAVKKAALDKIRSYLGPAGIELVAKAFGFGSDDMTRFLTSKVEATVFALGHGVIPNAAGNAPAGLPTFYASSPQYPAQKAQGAMVPPVTVQGIPGR